MSTPGNDQAVDELLANEVGALRLSPHPSAPRAPRAPPPPAGSLPPSPTSNGPAPTRRRIRVLTGTLPRAPLPEPSLNATGELVPTCPVEHCGFVQANARSLAEIARHRNAHFPGSSPFRCFGRPVHMFSIARLLALPYDVAEIYLVGYVEYVGGCGKEFSRMDALRRHLNARRCSSVEYCALVDGDHDGASA